MRPGDYVFRVLCTWCRLTLPIPPWTVRPCPNCGGQDYALLTVRYRGMLHGFGPPSLTDDGTRTYGTPSTAHRLSV